MWDIVYIGTLFLLYVLFTIDSFIKWRKSKSLIFIIAAFFFATGGINFILTLENGLFNILPFIFFWAILRIVSGKKAEKAEKSSENRGDNQS